MSAARRLFVATLFALVGGLVLSCASALALETLEAPGPVGVEARTTSATFYGELNPGKEGEAGTYELGTYEFLYKQGNDCEGGSHAPQTPGMSFGGGQESLPSEEVIGLKPHTEYTVCLRARSKAGETTVGPAATFRTALEAPEATAPTNVTSTSAMLNGVLNPGGEGEPGGYEFLYNASESECQGGEATGGSALGHEKEAVVAEVKELLPNTQYAVCVLVRNKAGETALGAPVTFTTSAVAPTLAEESVRNVLSTSAQVEAQVNPFGDDTHYYVQYGTVSCAVSPSSCTDVPALPGADAGSGQEAKTVSQILQDLAPATTYHYRMLARSGAGTVEGPDQTFTTPTATGQLPGSGQTEACPNEQLRTEQPYGLGLPDCRAYEMVSPPNTEGQDATDPFVRAVARAAVSGEAVTYASRGSFAGPTGGTFENQFLSRRGPEGWSTQAITPLHHAVSAETPPSFETMAFTPDLKDGIASTNASLTGEAPEGEWNFGLYVDDFANGSYRYVDDPFALGGGGYVLDTAGTSTDLSHVVVGTIVRGAGSGAWPVSEWVDGKVVLVSVTNKGEEIEVPAVGAASIDNVWRAVSANGSRVYFSSHAYNRAELTYVSPIPGQLYVRVDAEQPQSPMSGEECAVPTDACTIEVSASQRKAVDPHGPQTAHYWGASTDGSRVFFTSSAELTEDAATGPADNAANLYEYDLERPVGERLKDLTIDEADVDGAAVQGVVQVSEDGSYVYFVADGDLATGATADEPNLYVSHDDGAPRFIATLAARDVTDWEASNNGVEGGGGPETGTAVVTPSGARLAFISERSLTGYDNEQVEPGECTESIGSGDIGPETGECREIYLYNAETGGLVCASCNPSGARPVGPANFYANAGNYDEFRPYAQYRPRNLLEDGTLFFDSSDALVPHATDGRENVYEYEDGDVYPISDVAGGYESFFMDASPSGDDVFFGSSNQLLPQDTSNNVVVYDARVDGGFPVTVAPPPCDNGDSCRPPSAPQPGVFGAPGSATFSGSGNIVPAPGVTPVIKAKAKMVKCKKGHEKKKDKCVRQVKKKAKKSRDRKRSK